jgi:hypothetical protein
MLNYGQIEPEATNREFMTTMTKSITSSKPRSVQPEKNIHRLVPVVLVGVWLIILWFIPTSLTTLFFSATALLNLFGWVWVWKNLRE